MTGETVENIRLAVEAFNQRDAEAFVALAQPDVQWEDAVFWSEGSRTYRGRDELRQWFAEVIEPWETIHIELEEMIEAAADSVVVGLRLTARGKESGVDTQLHVWQVNWLADGKTARRQVFRDRANALEAAGLSE